MNKQIQEFIREAREQLRPSPSMDALQDPLGGLVGLVQSGPHSPRARDLRSLSQSIFDASDTLDISSAANLDRTALLVACRLAEEHLACRYSGEEWGDAFKVMDEAIAQTPAD